MAAKTNQVIAALRGAARDLDAIDARWALVGGFAVSARAEPRTTRDVDVAVAVQSEAEAEEVVRAMLARGYAVAMVLMHRRVRRIATVRLAHRDRPGVYVDLLFASSGIEPEVVAGAEIIEVIPRLELPIALTGDLVAMKLLARDDRKRPQDADDLMHLLRGSDAEQLARARKAVKLIEARGFARGRDLGAALTKARRAARATRSRSA